MPRGGNPLSIRVETPKGTRLYETEESVFEHATTHLSVRFRLAYSAPIYTSQLLDDIGHLGDTRCAWEIITGTYEYPADINGWTVKVLQEAHYTHKLLGETKLENKVSVQDYQQ